MHVVHCFALLCIAVHCFARCAVHIRHYCALFTWWCWDITFRALWSPCRAQHGGTQAWAALGGWHVTTTWPDQPLQKYWKTPSLDFYFPYLSERVRKTMCGLNKQDLQGPKRKDKHCGKLLPSICKKSRNVNHLNQEKWDVCQHLTFSPAVTTFLIKILRLEKSHVDVPKSHAMDLRIKDDQNVVLEGFQRSCHENCRHKV